MNRLRTLCGRYARPLRVVRAVLLVVLRVFWFGVCFIVPLYFLSTFGWNMYMILSSPSWPTANGMVSYVSAGETPLISYVYEVGGHTYYGERFSFGKLTAAELSDHHAGNPVTMWYAPRIPGQSVLKPGGYDPYQWAYLGLGIVFIGLGWLAFHGVPGAKKRSAARNGGHGASS